MQIDTGRTLAKHSIRKSPNKRKKYNQRSISRMAKAVEEFKSGADGSKILRSLAGAWNAPMSTLQWRISGTVGGSTQHCSGRKPVFSAAAEQELADVSWVSLRNDGDMQTSISIFNLNIFSDKKQAVGYYWFQNFLQHHKDFRVREPEVLSAARAMSMNKPTIDKWFEDYELLLAALGIKEVQSHIWATGLFPVNRAAIPETAFAPSRSTERQLPSGPAVSVSAEGGLSSTATAASSAGYTSFSSLVEVPHRERGQGRKHARLPTLLLSSPEHMDFTESKSKSTKERKAASRAKVAVTPQHQLPSGPAVVSEQFLNGTSAHNRPFQCHYMV